MIGRSLIAFLLAVSTAFGWAQDEATISKLEVELKETVQPFLKSYCTRCHGAKRMKSGVRVDQLDLSLEDKQLFLLKHIHKQLKDEAMPPEDERQPKPEERKAMIAWVEGVLLEGARQVKPKNGSMRRLTVAQFHNTLVDLLGVEDRLAFTLPADGFSKEGFKNNQDTLLLTPQMMETYFEIADKALDLTLVDDTKKPRIQSFRVELGAGLNEKPVPENIVLNGPSLMPKANFIVRQSLPDKPFPFDPLPMKTKYRFIEGYASNATVRGWREFNTLYHSVFVATIGRYTGGYNYGRSSHMAPEGFLLRPRSPETKNGRTEPHGPAPTFGMLMRELPKTGMLQITVEAARYDDALQAHELAPAAKDSFELDINRGQEATLEITKPGIYQLDVALEGPPRDDVIVADIGPRTFSKRLKGPYPEEENGEVFLSFLILRLDKGSYPLLIKNAKGENLRRAIITPIAPDSEAGRKFMAFEKRVPHLSVHKGVRTDVGARLSKFAEPIAVPSPTIKRYSFRAPVSGFASPEVEENNENYLAGLHEVGIRSEPTDGRQIPRVLIRAVEFEGPYYETWPPRGHREIFIPSPNKDDHPTYSREVLTRFATRAFRRPPSDQELASLLEVWNTSYTQTKNFQQGIRNALLVILTSPQFLYLTEESEGPQAEPISSHELAAKLSYFLWNSTPDSQLLEHAQEGNLRASLSSEVDRLIADERFARFSEEFVSQWLTLDKFDVVNVDLGRFPNLIRETRRELRKEPVHFMQHLIQKNLPLRNLIASDFIVANDVVAGYYGITSTEHGFAFAPVKHESSHRGGLLTQVAILSGLTDGHESNPVKRGAWLARKIIAEPPEPPPPNVPELPDDKESRTLSLRERLEQHRNQEGCAQCHQKIDPWGLPLEEFNAGGLFKEKKTDARSTLPDQTEIAGTNDLKRYLAEVRIDQVAFSFLQHLASYATGRSLTFNELEYLKREAPKALAKGGYKLRDCVLFIVQSPLFQEK